MQRAFQTRDLAGWDTLVHPAGDDDLNHVDAGPLALPLLVGYFMGWSATGSELIGSKRDFLVWPQSYRV